MKRLIICCDGTWQNSDGGEAEVPTNVTRITRAVKSLSYSPDGREISQIVYYQAGVGTAGSGISKAIGGGTGEGLVENVREAYGFLAHNYHPGDTVHLFGFSRGAYTARSICGMVCRLGILTKRGMDNFYKVYKIYIDKGYASGRAGDAAVAELVAAENGTLVTPNVEISTIGCWDTVGSMGIPTVPIPLLGSVISGVSASQYAFLDTDLSPKVLNAFHALALDEHRAPFTPTLWHKKFNNTVTNLAQCWFPGVHTNIGGGYEDQEIADMTLAWMIQACSPFIDFDVDYLHHITVNGTDHRTQWAAGKIYDSGTGLMRLAGQKTRSPGATDGTADGSGSSSDGGQTFETIHVSVRVREQVVKGWKSAAMAGWEWSAAQKAWVKGEKILKEDWLGDMEMQLAGQEIVVNLLGWAMPAAQAKRVVQEAAGRTTTTTTNGKKNGALPTVPALSV